MNSKRGIAAVLGAIAAIVGALLRLRASEIAWPDSFSYSGPRENTTWAILERAYQDVGLALLVFGLMVTLVVLIHWLWTPSAEHRH